MGIYEDLGKEVKNVADVVMLISEEKKAIQEAYLQLGELFVKNHGEGSEAPYAQYVNAVLEAEKKIAALNKQVMIIEGVQICEKCGAEVPTEHTYCGVCGKSFIPESEVAEPTPVAVAEPTPVAVAEPTPVPVVAPTPTPVPVVAPTPTPVPAVTPVMEERYVFCTNCGNKLKASSRFCTACGAPQTV